jgi:hypothetical protein
MMTSPRPIVSYALALAFGLAGGSAVAQTPVDTTGLGSGPFASMQMLYERTFLRVDVLRLHVRVGPETTARLQSLTAAGASGDSLAAAVMQAGNVLVRSRFLRNVSFDQFIDGLQTNLDHARRARFIDRSEFERIMTDVVSQYAPIRQRGIRNGDAMWYRIRNDSLHVVMVDSDGSILVEENPVGPERRLAVLGGYFAPGSDFRAPLLRSIGRAEQS